MMNKKIKVFLIVIFTFVVFLWLLLRGQYLHFFKYDAWLYLLGVILFVLSKYKLKASLFKSLLKYLGILLIVVSVGKIFYVNYAICSRAAGWQGILQTCTCKGKEIVIMDDLPADGERLTACFGVITEKKNFEPKLLFIDTPSPTNTPKTL